MIRRVTHVVKYSRWLLILSLLFALPLMAEEGIERLIVLHTNDIHGNITERDATWMNPKFPPKVGGGGRMARYINEVRADAEKEGAHVLLVDAGDWFQGTPVGMFDQGKTVIEFMNLLGYDAATFGNHDYDLGKENAQRLAEIADFPVLCANLIDESTGELADYVVPYIIKEFNGIRVALIGIANPDTKGLTPPDATKGLRFEKVAPTLKKYVKIVREQEKATVVIAVAHIGSPYVSEQEQYRKRVEEALAAGKPYEREFAINGVEAAALVEGVDLIIGGHIHYGLRKPYEDPRTHTLLTQTYANGSGVGHIELQIDKTTGHLIDYEIPPEGAEVTLFADRFSPVPEIAAFVEERRAIAEKGMDEVLGESLVDLTRGNYETVMGNLVTDAMREISKADVALVNRGGLRADLPAGELTPRKIFQVLPFQETIVKFTVDGKTLKDILETGVKGRRRDLNISGAKIVFDPNLPEMQRITELTIGGEPLDPNKTYEFVTSAYLAEGSIGYQILADLPRQTLYFTVSEAVEAYIRKNSPISPKIEGRITKIGGDR
ncbi:MAG: bifunctional metallophosphatase/5'-nucleotidase [Gemmatimonadetes bacterium]|nr:MAG: bifunctional metallophosphatase/5'-nucleotidase [Gemmatimonadota bacterium]